VGAKFNSNEARNPIGVPLRAWRIRAGLEGQGLAELLRCHPSKVSRIEHGHAVPTATEVRHWATKCGVDDVDAEAIVDRLFNAREILKGEGPVAAGIDRLRPYPAVMRDLGFIQLPAGGWACDEAAAEKLVELLYDYEQRLGY
jgi:transcriptional regulator with XRE-family HTH domain